ncbi:unnamed protein product, partial [Notodromas monacha]
SLRIEGLEVILEEPELENCSTASTTEDSCCCDCEDDNCSCCAESTSSSADKREEYVLGNPSGPDGKTERPTLDSLCEEIVKEEAVEPNKERLLEIYHETVRQRNPKSVFASILAFNNAAAMNNNNNNQTSSSNNKAKMEKKVVVEIVEESSSKENAEKFRLPSVKDLRCRFEQSPGNKPSFTKKSAPKPVLEPMQHQNTTFLSKLQQPNLKPVPQQPPKPVSISPVARKIEAAKSRIVGDSHKENPATNSAAVTAGHKENEIKSKSPGTELLTWKALSKHPETEKNRHQAPTRSSNGSLDNTDHKSDSEDSGINSNQSTPVWDPVRLAKDLYTIDQPDPPGTGRTLSRLRPVFERCDNLPDKNKADNKGYLNMEGYLEKLPSGRRKVTFWNAWKRRYFRLENGYLRYYQSQNSEKPSQTMQLMGGSVDTIENMMSGSADETVLQQKQMFPNVLGIDDGKGHYLVVKCATKNDLLTWQKALMTHVQENFAATYVQPSPLPVEPSMFKKVVVLDIGSRSLRAGILSKTPTFPQVFLPSSALVDRKNSSKRVFGFEAFCSDDRAHSQLVHPLRVTHKPSQRHQWDWPTIEGMLEHTIRKTKVDHNLSDYEVIVTIPWHLSSREFQTKLLDVLFKSLGFKTAYVVPQSLAAFHVYNANSGIVVDIGERLDVLPITHGFVVELGASKVLCGGETLASHLSMCLPGGSQVFAAQGDKLAVRYAMERLCYCAMDYSSEMDCFESDARQFHRAVPLPVKGEESISECESPLEVELDCGRFHGPEPEKFGLNTPQLSGPYVFNHMFR